MKLSCLPVILLLFQESPSDRLKREGWRAVRSLVEQGEAARAALADAVKGGDPDVAFYAQAALAELDRLRAGEFDPVARTRSTSAPAGRLVADLFKSAGLGISLEGLPDKTVTLPEGLTFAEAVDAVSRDLEVEFARDDKGSWRSRGPFLKVPRFASGMSRAWVEHASQGTYWKPGLPPSRFLWVAGHLQGFGRFGAPPLYAEVRVLEATDEHGRDLRRKQDWHEESIKVLPKQREPEGGFTVSLQAPDLKTTRVARLRLAADFSFKKKQATVTFDKPAGARHVRKTVGEVEATLVRAGMGGDKFNVELKVVAPGIGARIATGEDDPFIGSLEVRVLDAEGRAWEKGSGGSGSDGRELDVHAEFSSGGVAGPPATVSFFLITEVEVRSLFLEFRDVILP